MSQNASQSTGVPARGRPSRNRVGRKHEQVARPAFGLHPPELDDVVVMEIDASKHHWAGFQLRGTADRKRLNRCPAAHQEQATIANRMRPKRPGRRVGPRDDRKPKERGKGAAWQFGLLMPGQLGNVDPPAPRLAAFFEPGPERLWFLGIRRVGSGGLRENPSPPARKETRGDAVGNRRDPASRVKRPSILVLFRILGVFGKLEYLRVEHHVIAIRELPGSHIETVKQAMSALKAAAPRS